MDGTKPPGSPGTVTSRDGTSIAFDRVGGGPVLLVVGGALSTAASFAGLARRCARFSTVVCWDRRGRGRSGDRSPHLVADEVGDLVALCDEVGPPALCYGHSSGGLLALAAAATGAPIGRLVCYEPPFLAGDRSRRLPVGLAGELADLVAAGRREEAVESFLAHGTGMAPADLEALRCQPAWASMASLAHTLPYDVALCVGEQAVGDADVAAVTAPTLVLAGGESRGTIREAATDLADRLSDGCLEVVAGQRHVVESAALAPILEEALPGRSGEP